MGIFTDIEHLPAFRDTVITIGTFDGVHSGHKTILNEVVTHAQNEGGTSVLITFEPHPRKFLFPDQPLQLLSSMTEKIELIQQAGIEHIVLVPFTKAFSMLNAREYIEDFLVKNFHPKAIVIGYDHHFGHDRQGNLKLLEQLCNELSYKVYEIPAQLIDDATVSSTKIRKALQTGHVRDAAHMLGRHYTLTGTVYHGAKVGRTIGYPTANIEPLSQDKLIPANGIYAVYATHHGSTYKGMMSIGYNPTVTQEKILRIEVNIFNFSQEIYGDELTIAFVEKMRDEAKFPSLEALIQQLEKDKEMALQLL